MVLASGKIANHGLDLRIDLRAGSGEDLADTALYDMAWVPSAFIPEAAIPAILDRVQAALKPGGWLIFAMIRRAPDALATATTRFRTAVWGGSLLPFDAVAAAMQRVGLSSVRLLDGPAHSTIGMVAAQRAAE